MNKRIAGGLAFIVVGVALIRAGGYQPVGAGLAFALIGLILIGTRLKRQSLAIAGVATGMAFLGGALVLLSAQGDHRSDFRVLTSSAFILLTIIAFYSNVIWLPIGTYFATRRPPVWTALLIGAASSLVGCLLVISNDPEMAIGVFQRRFYILVPIGTVTGYLVWRVSAHAHRDDATLTERLPRELSRGA